jgi:hypothetical protein
LWHYLISSKLNQQYPNFGELQMIAIQTKYISPTNTRGSRIKAYTETGFTVTIPYDYSLNHEKVHFKAVKALVEKHNLDWDLDGMTYGGVKNGYVFCFNHSKVEA